MSVHPFNLPTSTEQVVARVVAYLNAERAADELGAHAQICGQLRSGKGEQAFLYRFDLERLVCDLHNECRVHESTTEDRDYAQATADTLAYFLFSEELIGVHSNLNDPWARALTLLEEMEAGQDAPLLALRRALSGNRPVTLTPEEAALIRSGIVQAQLDARRVGALSARIAALLEETETLRCQLAQART